MKAGTRIIGEPKTKSGIRTVPIPPPLLEDLAQNTGAANEPVFKQPTTGKRHTPSSMQNLWNGFKRALDISLGAKLYRNQIIQSALEPDLVPYCLRHTYGTDLQAAGVPLNVAKYLMGHSDISVTANIYTHTTTEMLEDVANKLGEYHN